MLQQTTVAAVVPLYERWMQRFPNPESLAEADIDEVMNYWSGLGYYQRARRLQMACQEIVTLSRFPDTLNDLIALPGLGPYTAAAVASIAFGRPELAIDTNVIRVLYRFFGWKRKRYDPASHRELRAGIKPMLVNLDSGSFNQALMELGGKVCTIRNPLCEQCPLVQECRAKALGQQSEIPLAETKKAKKLTPGQALVIHKNGTVLMVKGTSLGLLADLWQPPIVFQETQAQQDFHSRLLLRLRRRVSPGELTREVKYGISGRQLILKVISWPLLTDDDKLEIESLANSCGQETLWLSPDPAANGKVGLSSLSRKLLQSRKENP